ncbi:unnamed protein product [Urochloa decumbens]|uniref:Protein kinase domain-containing protein n=1 Tax=Urochloa decumbens TaxID=240449 RepID=A0ABC9F305_9POAL
MEEPEELTFQFLKEITDGFSEKRKVGEGTFGTVYRGVTKNGEDVAVKILRDSHDPDLDHRQFRNELYNLTKLKHNNIVEVLGYCYELEQIRTEFDGRKVSAEKINRALCFEYLHNGSLQTRLADESCELDWHTRYRIIKGTCEGLKYIHKDLGESLYHLDLKPNNILVDKNMVPKIGDFGLSKIFGDELKRTTQSLLGTPGYQPPEYIERGEISEKFDIFSLGVIIIRIVSGSDDTKHLDMPSDEFIDQIQRNWREKWQETCSSGFFLESCCRQVKTCTQIALDCLENDSQKRPDIVMIIDKLNEIGPHINEPNQKVCETVCGMTMNNEMRLTKEHRVIYDRHQQSNFMISSRSNETGSGNTQEKSLDVVKELIVGREEKKNRMASLIERTPEKIIIFPICGFGGIGKTTFARLLYNDTNFKYYSQVWVYVSPRFDLCKIGNTIISQLSGKWSQANDLQLIKSDLTKLLSGKKIMIVLDDLWENNTIQLVDLKNMLNPGESIKTIVLVTTRSEDIAKKICSNIEPYKIEVLTDEMCWDIIKQKSAFEDRADKEKLMAIGKDIAFKCGGVALAAQTLGSMLQSMKYDQWMTVKDSDIWNETISKDASLPNHVLASLKLSYLSMDDRLKSCFTYCAIFPKGHRIVKYDLIYQWISLGFIKPTLLSTLQLCEKYIMRLLGLTFLQHPMSPTNYRAYGEHDTVLTMHDLVHDLAISLLGDQILDQTKQVNTGGSNCCYALLTDCSKPLESCTASLARLSALRFLDCWWTELHGAAFEPAESLRVLDLSECFIHKLPDSIARLKQLRYLNAPRIRDRMVPECITKHSNLRYLSLRRSFAIRALPKSIGEMESLVHLDLSGCMGIEELPESFGDLKSLEHLDFSNCKNVTGVSHYLARLTKLQHLNLSNCKNIGDLPRALGSLTELQYLNLSDSSYLWGNKLAKAEFLGSFTKLKYLNLFSSNAAHYIRLPEALGSITELEYLNLSRHFTMGKLPASFVALNGLTKLQYLDLYACSGFNAMEGLQEVFGNLSELCHLNLGCCIAMIPSSHPDEIDGLLGQICTLTNLEYLNLSENDNIYSIPETLANLRKLHTLDLSWCGNMQRLPASLSELDSLKFLYTMECWTLDRSTPPQYNKRDGEFSSNPFQLEYKMPAQLKIRRLENMQSSKEAQTIDLMWKTDIKLLTLKWTTGAKRFVDDAEVLRELEPPYSISEFHLEGYNGASFPPWVMSIGASLPGLTSIEMSDLPSCNNLPPLGQLPNLEWLSIRRMDSIKKIDADLYGGAKAFPRLEYFCIHDMICLEEWNTAYSSDEDGCESVFPCLRSVEIRHCPRLSLKPCLPLSIAKLQVHNSDEVMLSSLEKQGHAGASTARCSLQVECCVVPLYRWSLLCHLPCLEHLTIKNCSDLTCSSPDFLRDLTSLQTLTVEFCKSIASLPESLGDLTSLTKLEVRDCMGIRTLPDSIQQLTGLQCLEISGCTELVRWCESEENKMKLAHIKTKPPYSPNTNCRSDVIWDGKKRIMVGRGSAVVTGKNDPPSAPPARLTPGGAQYDSGHGQGYDPGFDPDFNPGYGGHGGGYGGGSRGHHGGHRGGYCGGRRQRCRGRGRGSGRGYHGHGNYYGHNGSNYYGHGNGGNHRSFNGGHGWQEKVPDGAGFACVGQSKGAGAQHRGTGYQPVPKVDEQKMEQGRKESTMNGTTTAGKNPSASSLVTEQTSASVGGCAPA